MMDLVVYNVKEMVIWILSFSNSVSFEKRVLFFQPIMSNIVYEDNRVDPSKVGKKKSIYEEDVEETILPPRQPSYNPGRMTIF
jgi:hypothetical protein